MLGSRFFSSAAYIALAGLAVDTLPNTFRLTQRRLADTDFLL